MLAPYRQLLTHRGVPQIIAAALLTRLGPPVLSLALLLAVLDQTGSYASAGLVLTSHALALAGFAPVGGRLADRIGPRRVLTGFLAGHALTYGTLLAGLAVQAPTWALITSAALLGATNPPASAIIRGAWPRLVPSTSLTAAYAVDNVTNELMFVIGPVLVSALQLVMSAPLVVAVAGAAVLMGTAFLLGSQPVRRAALPSTPRDISPRRLARLAGPLTHRPTLVLLIIATFGTFTFGSLRIATVAAATTFGAANAAGLLMGLLSAGTIAGALTYGARAWPMTGRRLLILICIADSVILLADAVAPTLLTLALLIAATGFLIGPRETVQPTLLAQQAPAEHGTEVFAWLNTFMWVGYGLGTAIAGHLTGPADSGAPAFIAAASAALLGAALVAMAMSGSVG
jgi:MFS family permease